MDMKTVVSEVGSWPVEERLRLMEEIWGGLLEQGYAPELSEEQITELHRRLADDNAAPDEVVAWDEVKAAALKRAGQARLSVYGSAATPSRPA
jgi:putative addiction module component (TIGR02574 family)